MEFTLSRVVMSVCALMIIAILAPQIQFQTDDKMENEALALAISIDSFLQDLSEEDGTLRLECRYIVPSPEWTVELGDGFVVVRNSELSVIHHLRATLEGQSIILGYGDTLLLLIEDGCIHLLKVETSSSSASANLSMSLSLL